MTGEADMLTNIIRVSSQSSAIKINPNTFLRIGRPGDKCRPIRLVCQNANEKLQCVRFKHLLKRDQFHHKVFIANDLTRIQREKRRRQISAYANFNHGQPDYNEARHNISNRTEASYGQPDHNEVGQSPLHFENVNTSRRRTDQQRIPTIILKCL